MSTPETAASPHRSHPEPSGRAQSVALVTGAFGQNLVYATVTTFLLLYLVEHVKLSLAGIAVVTTVIAVARILDAIADPVVGGLVDRTRTRWGKLRPFILVASPPVAVLSALLFAVPDADEPVQLWYFSVGYLLWGLAYAACDVPLWGLIGSAFPEQNLRARVIGNVRAFGAIALGLTTLGMPYLAKALSFDSPVYGEVTTGSGWSLAVALTSVVGIGLLLLAVFIPRERAVTTEPLSFRHLFGALFANKPLLAVLAGSLLGTGRYIVQAGGAVFVVIVYDDETAFSILGAGIIGGMVIAAFITPVIMRRVSGRTLILFSCFAGAVVYVAMYLAGFENLLIVTSFVFLTGLLLGVFLVAQTTMIADAVDRAEETTGIRNDGISFATLTFVTKVMSAFSVLIFGAFLVIAGYEEGVAVTRQMQDTVWIAITLVPAISCLLSAIPFFAYRLSPDASSTS